MSERMSDEGTRRVLIGRMVTAGLSRDSAEWVVAGWPWDKPPQSERPRPEPGSLEALFTSDDPFTGHVLGAPASTDEGSAP